MAALAVAACSLQDAQAIERVNDGGKWTDADTWYENRETSNLTSFTDGQYVRFYKRDDGKTNYRVTINSNVTPVGIDVGTDYTFRFDTSGSNVSVSQQLNKGQTPQFLVQQGVTLTLKKVSTAGGKGILEVYNVGDRTHEKGLAGSIVIGDQTTFRIKNEDLKATDYVGYLAGTASITVQSGGTFALRHSLWLTDPQAIQRNYHRVDVTGNLTYGEDYFNNAYEYAYFDFIHKEEGGTLNIAEGVVITTTEDGVNYGVDRTTGRAVNYNDHSVGDMTTYYKHGAGTTVALSSIYAKAGAALVLVDMTAGTLTVDQLVSTVTVNAAGGTLAFAGGGGVGAVNVTGDITVSGDTNPEGKVYKIDSGKKITFEDNLEMEGVSIVGTGGTKVSVQNTSGSTTQYSLANGDIVLTASEVALIEGATQDATVGNQVHAATIANNSNAGKALTLSNGVSGVQHISAVKGDIFMKNMGANSLSVESMTIGEGKQVGLYTGSVAAPAQEAAVSIRGVLSAKGGTVLSNLAMADNSTLDLVGGQMTMAGNLSFGSNIYLDAATMKSLDALAVGDTYEIILHDDGVQKIIGDFDGKWYGEIFSRVSPTPAGGSPYELQGDFQLIINEGGNVAFRKVSDTPEPTTGTLSLLALCALAARRRRK